MVINVQLKRRITGSVSTVTEKDLQGKPLTNLDMMLQGKVAGVDIKATRVDQVRVRR